MGAHSLIFQVDSNRDSGSEPESDSESESTP